MVTSCSVLARRRGRHPEELDAAEVFQDAIEGCAALLADCQPAACSGWYCKLLYCRCVNTCCLVHGHGCSCMVDGLSAIRAQARLGRRQLPEAAADLTEALVWEPFSADTLLLRAKVLFSDCWTASAQLLLSDAYTHARRCSENREIMRAAFWTCRRQPGHQALQPTCCPGCRLQLLPL